MNNEFTVEHNSEHYFRAPANLSVIVTVHSSGDYLEKCLTSLASQTLPGLEIVIVNDCSPDPRDDKIIRKFLRSGVTAQYIRNAKNLGTGASREIGVRAATGEYIGFLDSDDYVESFAFETLFEQAKRHDCDVAVANFRTVRTWNVDTTGQERPRQFAYEILPGWELFESQILRLNRPYYLRVDWWNKIYRRELFLANDVRFPHVVRNEGTMSMIMSLLADRCIIIDLPLFYTSTRPDSVCRSMRKQHIDDTIKSTLHFRSWLEQLGVLERYYDAYLKFFYFVVFNHNVKLACKLGPTERNALLGQLARSLKEDRTCWLDFLRYINLREKRIERLAFSTISTGSYADDILALVAKTDFVNRRRIGAPPAVLAKGKVLRPRVTIVTILKDIVAGARLDVFRQMLASVRNQRFPRDEIEHVIIDAGSGDGTIQLLQELVEQGEIDWVLSEPDNGIYNAMNKGAMVAAGEFVLYLNSDDYLAPDALSRLCAKADQSRADYVFGNAIKVNDSGKRVGAHIGNMDKVFYGTPYCHQALLCRKKCFRDVHFDEAFQITMWSYALRLFERGYRYAYVDHEVAYFRVGGVSTDPKFSMRFRAEQDRIKADLIVPRLHISLQEYEFLNCSWRRWPTPDVSLSVQDIIARLSYPETAFQRAFLEATKRLCCDLIKPAWGITAKVHGDRNTRVRNPSSL